MRVVKAQRSGGAFPQRMMVSCQSFAPWRRLHPAAEALARSHTSETTTEMPAALHGCGHHALRILAAAASNSWIESTNSKITSRGDANIGSCCCSIVSRSPITRRARL